MGETYGLQIGSTVRGDKTPDARLRDEEGFYRRGTWVDRLSYSTGPCGSLARTLGRSQRERFVVVTNVGPDRSHEGWSGRPGGRTTPMSDKDPHLLSLVETQKVRRSQDSLSTESGP